jgi:hypothetical protein
MGGAYLCPVRPKNVEELYANPVHRLVSHHYAGAVVLPRRMIDIDVEEPTVGLSWYLDHVFVSTSNPYYSYMETIGCLRSEPLDILCLGGSGFDRLLKEFDTFSPRLYSYTVVSLPRSVGFVRTHAQELDSYFISLSGLNTI